ncbi:hypothetical protein GYMLUDRAFT_60896 [Collybiopsis luxurians FD-317 M1]|uniref:MATE efflux family protein n=1 Tax=Collybiopsis luxurians FD-317 M1 TaxID=944289 RepID=A0A0D0CR73_9AGAR|nr:hypothetical protein GYMLUDRAFT_60896 [Collybiopsis luxurians FD-317 M1]
MEENLLPTSTATSLSETQPLLGKQRQRESLKLIWSEALAIMKSAIPIYGMNILEYSLVGVAVLSVGHISTVALAAAIIAEMSVNIVGLSIISGFTVTMDTVLSSAWTNPWLLVGLLAQSMTLIVGLVLLPTINIWFHTEALLLKFYQEPEVAKLAGLYLRCRCIGLPDLFTLSSSCVQLFQWAVFAMSRPNHGGRRSNQLVFELSLRKTWYPITLSKLRGILGSGNLGLLFKLGLTGVRSTVWGCWAWDIVGLAASQLGSNSVLASYAILLVTVSTLSQGPFSLGIATSIRIGNLLREKDALRAGAAAKSAVLHCTPCPPQFIRITVQRQSCYIYLPLIIDYFHIDVVSTVASIIPLLATFQIFDAIAGITSGILRARNKQILDAALNITAFCVLGIPLGFLLVFSKWSHMGLAGVWVALTFALVYIASFGLVMSVRTPNWEEEVRKAEMRVALEGEKERVELGARERRTEGL